MEELPFKIEINQEEHKSEDSIKLRKEDGTLHSLEPRVNEFLQAPCYDDDDIYYRFGVIDFLQAYTRKKKIETILLRKRYKKKPPNCFSCVEPNVYADRFYEFMLKNLFTKTRYFPEHELEKNEKEMLNNENRDSIVKQKRNFLCF